MSAPAWAQFGLLAGLVLLLAPLMGRYMAAVFGGGRAPGDRVFLPVERFIYRLVGIDQDREQRWTRYAGSLLVFSFVSIVVLYAIQRLQGSLPFNPDHRAAVDPFMSLNNAASFTTNTDWQSYVPESTVSIFTQTVGIVFQNFMSAATGLAVAVALIRGLVRRRADTIGNFWVDITPRCDPDPVADQLRARDLLHESGCHPELPQPAERRARRSFTGRGEDRRPGGGEAHGPGRAGRQSGGDQGARQQRRRILQRELRASLREPDRLGELRPDARGGDHRLRPAVHLRAARGQSPSGLCALWRDARALGRSDGRHDVLRDAWQPEAHHRRRGSEAERHAGRRQSRGQGGALGRGRRRDARVELDEHLHRFGRGLARLVHRARRRDRHDQHLDSASTAPVVSGRACTGCW